MGTVTPGITVAQARQLITDYTYTIDDGAVSQWPTYFTEPCLYRITTRQNHEMIMPLSIMLCDNQAMLYDRVEAIEKANIFEPHYYRHVLSDSKVIDQTDSTLHMETSFICVRTMLDGRVTLFATGRYSDQIVFENGRCLFRSRVVILDSSKVDTLLAIPL
ncbi:aromatic-ring-hydroxylating dioxygenase subunit beta [Pseudomonas typographi]|uniref:SnoaL-like domain-containing protein n=1 Tax=Pseudomonas typographi TaxID=2715964 RepID=A0ABR7Z8R2_9PSED|nr:aromatic-ring-hydroxylating dioxygenase subunit beta [Pseudomonas typographi]MBD1552043.1 SnoaL-like domain-containing protein [Pseudomonas typographi]MBD1586606.1 SnoaL-like domain-containing protein [Pseudomonas typographi]MBD1601758.1 SnoaL-like domain-containing protein [Pseudomonas typographi]